MASYIVPRMEKYIEDLERDARDKVAFEEYEEIISMQEALEE